MKWLFENTVFEWWTSLLPQNMALLKTVIKYMKVVESDLKYELYWRKCEEKMKFFYQTISTVWNLKKAIWKHSFDQIVSSS